MIRLWAKVMREGKIVRQTTYEREDKLVYSAFFGHLAEICGELDVPTPVLLKPHIFQFAKFRHVVFRPADFLEPVDFDKLIVENIL